MGTTSQSRNCPKCGGPILPEAPQGLCPKCLLAQAANPTDAGRGAPSKSAPPTREELAAAFPQLEIFELVGQGGMGFVFKARQPKIERLVALKILPQSLAADPAFAERFTREGRLLARLNHPNIVTLYDFGQAGGFFYLLMEFVDGVNLRQAMRVGRFTPAQALSVVPKVCEALQFAHNEGILHRDIKPENILLDTKGRVKIADFGIAKLLGEPQPAAPLTVSGTMLGTPHYIAPEQLEHSGEVDQRADIYSLGVVFYEMLTGELPLGRFQPPSAKAPMDARLDEVVLHALEKEPARRYQQAREVKTAVETISSTPAPAATPSPPHVAAAPAPPAPQPDRFWRRFALGVLVLLAIPVSLVVFHLLGGRAREQALEQPPTPVVETNPVPDVVFGPVVELTLNRASTGTNCLLRFGTGELSAPPPQNRDSATAMLRWAQQKGVDAGVGVTNNVLTGFDMAAVPAPAECWEELTPAQAAARLEDQPASSFVVLLHTYGSLPETCAFRTREGRVGVLQLTGFASNPPGIRIRYKITGQPLLATAAPGAAAATNSWAPALLPGEKPDFGKILEGAKLLTATAHFEEALQRYQWHFEHALDFGDSWQNAVRLTSALSDWADLGRRYPKARQALLAIRDHRTREITEGRGDVEMFHEVQAINRALQDEDATYALFKAVRESDPKLVELCRFYIEDLLVTKGEYEWLFRHLGDPQARFDSIRQIFEIDRARYSETDSSPTPPPRMRTNGLTPVPPVAPPRLALRPELAQMMKQSAETRFVGQTCQLIEILCGARHKAEADNIRNQAVAVLDHERLKSAVTDAEKRVQQRSPRTGNL